MSESLPCIVCRKKMQRIFDGGYELQPNDGLHFSTEGAYGTTVFDPMDGSTLDVIICDECIVAAARDGLVLFSQPRVGLVSAEDGVAVGYYHSERESVPWDPDKYYPRQDPAKVTAEEVVEGRIPLFALVRADAIQRARRVLAEDKED